MTCTACGHELAEDVLFCEECGAKVGFAVAPTALSVPESATDELSPISQPTAVRPGVVATAPQTRTCVECGGSVAEDGYCDQCGKKAASERDHFREAPALWLAGVCDRGVRHSRNEDAMALFADPAVPGRSVAVVCDGVSSSRDSDVASLAAARAARDVLRTPMPQGLGVPESVEAAAVKVFTTAAAAANNAVIANTDPSSDNPASCTFVVGVAELVGGSVGGAAAEGSAVEGAASPASTTIIRYAVIGDSRAYWLPDDQPGVQLTTDDSMAEMLIAGGTSRAEAEAAPQAHAITKWLGKDSPDIVPVCGSLVTEDPGWLLVCSDGLWNYASEADALRAKVDEIIAGGTEDPPGLALALVEFAKVSGGHDNITVAMTRVNAPVVEPPSAEVVESEAAEVVEPEVAEVVEPKVNEPVAGDAAEADHADPVPPPVVFEGDQVEDPGESAASAVAEPTREA